jgi:hypothetical protein
LEETESKPGKGKKKIWLRCGGRGGCVWAEGAQLLASGKKGNLMKGEGAAASREMRKGRGAAPPLKIAAFRVRFFFFVFSSSVSKLTPLLENSV